MTDREIVEKCNELAREFYLHHGCQVKKGFRFDLSTHPQEQQMWRMAVFAFDFLLDTDVENALAELEDE